MPGRNRLILVVEDIPLIRMGVLEMLVEAGFLAVEAGSADEAIQILEARPEIRLVFTDVQMPGSMDGLKLSHYIRNRWPPVQLILASGKAMIDESQLPSGARFFAKPYDSAEVIRTIIGMLPESPGEPARH